MHERKILYSDTQKIIRTGCIKSRIFKCTYLNSYSWHKISNFMKQTATSHLNAFPITNRKRSLNPELKLAALRQPL